VTMATAAEEGAGRPRLPGAGQLLLALAAIILAAPTLYRLGVQVWSKEIGAHGPIVLATGAWILWREIPAMVKEGRTGHPVLTVIGAFVSLAIYVFGRAYDLISLEAAGLYGFGLAILHDRFGVKTLLKNWFPILYLGLLLPLPGWMLDEFTAPLKLFVSVISGEIALLLGVPLIGLVAITLFYVYLLRNAGWKYSLFLLTLIIPVAVLANVIRIVFLILLTYNLGDAVGQGFLHVSAGLFLFALSLGLMFAIDSFVSRVWPQAKAGGVA
jgi:exosortase/archaeosortase family protein